MGYYLANVTSESLRSLGNNERFVHINSDYVSVPDAVRRGMGELGITEPGEYAVLVMWGVDPNPLTGRVPESPYFRIAFVTVPEREVVIDYARPYRGEETGSTETFTL